MILANCRENLIDWQPIQGGVAAVLDDSAFDSAFETKLLFHAFQKENVFQLTYLANRPLK